jgi:uncharacterized membrane protein YidH (DUF202 family)
MITRRVLFVGVILVLTSCLQWLPLIESKWSIRNDHDFVQFMATGRISWAVFVQQLNPPEVALGGLVNRPVYYIVHDVWMLVIGNNLPIWQGAKIMEFAVTVFLFFVFFRLWIETVPATALFLYVSTLPHWGDVVPLANAELFAVFGVVVYLIGNSLILLDETPRSVETPQKRTFLPQCLVAVGAVIAVGSKENFCFCILVSAVCLSLFGLVLGKKPQLAVAQAVPFLSACVLSYLIFSGIRSNQGYALYNQTFDLLAICGASLRGFVLGGVSMWLPIGLFLLFAFWAWQNKDVNSVGAALLEALLAGIVLLNFGFYTGYDLVLRYAFPVNLVPALALLPLLWKNRWSHSVSQKTAIYLILLIGCLALGWTGFSANLRWAENFRVETRKFDARLRKVVSAVAVDPKKPLLFESYAAWDLEPMVSVQQFLKADGVRNPMYAKLNYTSAQFQNRTDSFFAELTEERIGRGKNFEPVSELQGEDHFRITFSAPKSDDNALANFYGQE